MAGTGDLPAADAASRFARIYDAYMPRIYRYIGYHVPDAGTAEDLTSVVFEKALVAFPRYRDDLSAPQTWLTAIARNVVTDHLRRCGRDQSLPIEAAESVACPLPAPGEQVEKKDQLARLHYCLGTLDARHREIVSLKFGAELTNRRIAETLRFSETNVGTLLFRALRKLRECLKGWFDE